MGKNTNKEKVTVEALLRIKRNERPSSDFWNSFENDFERRRLHALLERDTLRHSFWHPALKAAMFGLPAFVILAVSVLWIQNSDRFASEQVAVDEEIAPLTIDALATDQGLNNTSEQDPVSIAYSSENLSSQFVVDAIESNTSASMNFQKVLYTPALHLSAPSGSSYVRDSLSARTYGSSLQR